MKKSYLNVRDILNHRKMSTSEFAELVGVSELKVCEWLTGIPISQMQRHAIKCSLLGYTKPVEHDEWVKNKSRINVPIDATTIRKIEKTKKIPTHIQRIIRHAIEK